MSTDVNGEHVNVQNGFVSTRSDLADGREIIYYDAAATHVRDAVDLRSLNDAPTRTELRRDPLLDQWVVVAGHRQARTFLPPTSECPLCPTHGNQLTEIPEADYEVVVFENRFPSLTQIEPESTIVDPLSRHGFGRCEVVCFTSQHSASFADVSAERCRLVLEAWIDRDRALSAIPGIEYVFIFENRGVEIGVTISHPHGQIYAYPFIPPRDMQMRRVARSYRAEHGSALYEDVINFEIADGRRVVYDGEHWIVFVPHAAKWPFEMQIFTRRSVKHIRDLNEGERTEFSEFYPSLLRALDTMLGVPMPYIAAWHQAPVGCDDDDSRLFLEVFSLRRAAEKLKYLAGSESAAWVWINDISPEQAAQSLREARARTST